MPELAPRPPMVAWPEASREIPMPPSAQRLRGPRELVLNPVPEFEGKPSWPTRRRKVVPRSDPHPPQPFLGPVADARDMDERFAQHPRHRNCAPQKALAERSAEPRKSLIRGGLMAARVRDPGARRTRAERSGGDRARSDIDPGAPARRQPEPAHHSGAGARGPVPRADPDHERVHSWEVSGPRGGSSGWGPQLPWVSPGGSYGIRSVPVSRLLGGG